MALASLESKEHRNLLDIIDKLRSQGIHHYVDLPQIIVCGDQSSGKSSVLEAISGMSFPVKDNLCTRFATELILRCAPTEDLNISVVPDPERTPEEKEKLRKFSVYGDVHELNIEKVVEEAKIAMDLSGSGKRNFSTDTLRVELSGPSQPHLTMVDLPGLFSASDQDQSQEDAELVKSMVLNYMKSPRSIILAVVSAKSDFALQPVTQHVRAYDPDGKRTLGLITKPDKLDKGSEMERKFVEYAKNENVKFRLGWHVLKNRHFEIRNTPSSVRDQVEKAFFGKGIWTELAPSQLGVGSLRVRLSNVLKDQIIGQLPSLLGDIEKGILDCNTKLEKLGESRATTDEQRQYLTTASDNFSQLIQAASEGNYRNEFFNLSDTKDWSKSRRLRAIIQKSFTDFVGTMQKNGRAVEVVDTPVKGNPRHISRAEYTTRVKHLMETSKGCELPGTFNPLIIGELFREQSKPWIKLAAALKREIISSTGRVVCAAILHVSDKMTAERIIQHIINPMLVKLDSDLHEKITEIVSPHQFHAITYNHYFTDNVQKAQADRQKLKVEESLRGHFKVSDISKKSTATLPNISLQALANALTAATTVDMDEYACITAIDMVDAYYKSALKLFIDNVAALANERCLMQKLPKLFRPETVAAMDVDTIRRIAGEPEESIIERKRLERKLSVLEAGRVELDQLKKEHGSPELEYFSVGDENPGH